MNKVRLARVDFVIAGRRVEAMTMPIWLNFLCVLSTIATAAFLLRVILAPDDFDWSRP